MAAEVKITDILSSEHCAFLAFCSTSGKQYRSELTGADFVAFRSCHDVPRDQIAALRKLIESYESVNDTADSMAEEDALNPLPNAPTTCCEEKPSVKSTTPPDVADGTMLSCGEDGLLTEDLFPFNSEMPLYQILGVSWEPYANDSILESDVGVRAYNSLRAGRKKDGSLAFCASVSDLLRLSPMQLSLYKNMGKRSVMQIFRSLHHKTQSVPPNGQAAEDDLFVKSAPYRSRIREQVLSMLLDEAYEIAGQDEAEVALLTEYRAASDVIGKEIAFEAASGKQAVISAMRMLSGFYKEPLEYYAIKTDLEKDASTLLPEIKQLPVKPFLFAYHVGEASLLTERAFPIEASTSVHDFVRCVTHTIGDAEETLEYARGFVRWLHFDMTALCGLFRKCVKGINEKAREVFFKRVQGETLEAIGVSLGVTRERIRQMELKVVRRFAIDYRAQAGKYDILTIIHALRGGDMILRYEEITAHLDVDDANVLWYLAKRELLDCDAYHYSQQINAIVFGKEITQDVLARLVNELPEIIETSEMPRYVAGILEKYPVTEELIRIRINSTYKCEGVFYHRTRLTIVFLCDYILRTRFQNGYKIADPSDQKRFITYMSDMAGGKVCTTVRAVDAKIGTLGVLIDRGKYVHSSYITVDKDIITDVISYIEKSERIVLTYTELFDTFAERFAGTQIANRYSLQGVLKLYGCPFIMRKDYITKEDGSNLSSEFERFVKQSGKVHKSVLLEEFNGLSEINLGFLCQRLPDVVVLDGGDYMHASQLNIAEEDYQEQQKFLSTVCSDAPVSSRMLYNEYLLRFTDFVVRNNIDTHGALFGVIQHMFRDDFYFSRPYISLNCSHDLTNRGVLLQNLADTDSIEIEDLVSLCNKRGINYISLPSLMELLEPDFIRVDELTLMRKDRTGLDDDAVMEAAQRIMETVHVHGGYCSSKNITDFSWFPDLNIPWNAYLLESVAALAGDLLTILHITTSTVFTPVAVYIGEEYASEDMNSLIIRLLREESRMEPYKSREDILAWLQEQGLCNVKFPSFLETEGYLSCDSLGRWSVR